MVWLFFFLKLSHKTLRRKHKENAEDTLVSDMTLKAQATKKKNKKIFFGGFFFFFFFTTSKLNTFVYQKTPKTQ
jgi:hypothetical protein